MKKLEIFDRTKTYIFPNGEIGTPERVRKDFPAAFVDGIKYVVGTDEAGVLMASMDMFSILKSIYNIDPTLSDDEALQAIEDVMNTPPEEPAPSPEERIAAMVEYQVMSSLPDEE